MSAKPLVVVTYDQEGWTFHRIARQIEKHLSDEFDVRIQPYTAVVPAELHEAAILCNLFYAGVDILDRFASSTKLVTCLYSAYTWRKSATMRAVLEASMAKADMALFANRGFLDWIPRELRRVPERRGLCRDGVDIELFQPQPDRPAGGPLVVGWAGARGHGDEVKGVDLIEAACRDLPGVVLSVAAREGGGGQGVLPGWAVGLDLSALPAGIQAMLPKPETRGRKHDEMAAWYRGIDVYLCASSVEGTPNPILEASACQRTWISTPVGLVPEILEATDPGLGPPGLVVERDVGALREAICQLRDDRASATRMARSARRAMERAWSWPVRVEAFREAFRAVLAAGPGVRRAQMAERPDYSNDLTVFVITCGEPDTAECLARLERQDCRFKLDVVRDVTPMNAAFQQMLERCTTPYYVQVDSDMLLHPHAVRTMYEDLRAQTPEVAFVCYPLHDLHLDQLIQGVKCYRHAIMARYPYVSSYSCEVDQLARLRQDGFRIADYWPSFEAPAHVESFDAGFRRTTSTVVLGYHAKTWTPEMIFVRYKRLLQKYRRFRYDWLQQLPQRFLDRLPGSALDLWAFLGAVTGLSGPLASEGEQDSKATDPDYAVLAAHLRHERSASTDQAVVFTSDGEPPAVDVPVPAGPTELDVYLTTKCNLRCAFCRRQQDGVAKAPDVTPAQLRKVLQGFPTIRGVCIAGFGEPLLHPEIREILRVVKERGVAVGLITNGLLLPDHASALAEIKPDYISISLNATNADDYRAATGCDRFDEVLRGIRSIVQRNVRVGLSSVATRRNWSDVPLFMQMAAELAVNFVSLHNLLPHGEVDEAFWSGVLTTGDTEILAALDAMHHDKNARLVEHWPTPISRRTCPRKCRSPFVAMGIDGAGSVTGCRRVVPPDAAHGNVQDAGVWTGEYLTDLRARLTGHRGAHSWCKGCFGNWLG